MQLAKSVSAPYMPTTNSNLSEQNNKITKKKKKKKQKEKGPG